MNEIIDDVELPTEKVIKSLEQERQDKIDQLSSCEGEMIEKARDGARVWDSYFSQNNLTGEEMAEFLIRSQWTPVEKAEFDRTKKPALSVNFLYDTVRKIQGEQRQNTPDLVIRSKNGIATQKDIDLHTDIIQSVSYNSRTELVYQQAFSQALVFGYGAFQVHTDYENSNTFNQVIKYRCPQSPFRVFFDPSSQEPTKWDSDFNGEYIIITKKEYRARFPHDDNPASFPFPQYEGLFVNTKDNLCLCSYEQKEYFPVTLYELSTGESIKEDEWRDMEKRYKKAISHWDSYLKDMGLPRNTPIPVLPTIVRSRQTYDYKTMQYLLSASKILDVTYFPSKYPSRIFVDGDSFFLDGKQVTRPFIYYAKDAQKFVNYLCSETASQVKNLRREQWVGTPENVEGDDIRRMWLNPENQQGILLAKRDRAGQLPQKIPPGELPQTLLMNYQRGIDDIKRILGFYDVNLGADNGSEVSGVAIRNRGLQGGASTYIYQDNLGRAIEQGGRVALDLMPTIYDTERNLTIKTQDGKNKAIKINKKLPNGQIYNKIDTTDMDIEISVGPSFAMQKTQAIELFIKLLNIPPQSPIFPLVVDLIAKNLDLQNMPQLVERLETLVPPQILAKEKGLPPPPPPPPDPMQVMAMQQSQQQSKMNEIKMQIQMKEVGLKQEQNEIEKMKVLMGLEELRQKAANINVKSAAEMQKASDEFSVELLKLIQSAEKNIK